MSATVIQFPKVPVRRQVTIEQAGEVKAVVYVEDHASSVPSSAWTIEKWPPENGEQRLRIDHLNKPEEVVERSKQALVRDLFKLIDTMVEDCGRELTMAVLRTAVKSLALKVE